jgi:hypothetical protein
VSRNESQIEAAGKKTEQLRQLNELGKEHGIDWQEAANKAFYRGTLTEFVRLIQTGDDRSLEDVNRVLRAWFSLINEKKLQMTDARGASPKSVSPSRTNKVVEQSIGEQSYPVLHRFKSRMTNRALVLRWKRGTEAPLDLGFEALTEIFIAGLVSRASK